MTDPTTTGAVAERVKLEDVTPSVAAYFAADPCPIWSGEHRMWWCADGHGYTMVRERAGRYTLGDAYDRTRHCDPDKAIAFERIAATAAPGGGYAAEVIATAWKLARPEAPARTSVLTDVQAERERQIAKGWTPEHDDEHDDQQIAWQAAYCIARLGDMRVSEHTPWVKRPDRDRRGLLIKGIALAVAEVERLDRVALPATADTPEAPDRCEGEGLRENAPDAVIAEVEAFLSRQGGFLAYADHVRTGTTTGWSRLRSTIWLAVLAATRRTEPGTRGGGR